MAANQGVTKEELVEGLRVALLLVELDGDIYMPTVNRLIEELENINARDKTLARAQKLLIEGHFENAGAA